MSTASSPPSNVVAHHRSCSQAFYHGQVVAGLCQSAFATPLKFLLTMMPVVRRTLHEHAERSTAKVRHHCPPSLSAITLRHHCPPSLPISCPKLTSFHTRAPGRGVWKTPRHQNHKIYTITRTTKLAPQPQILMRFNSSVIATAYT